jgi:hypothetical protein
MPKPRSSQVSPIDTPRTYIDTHDNFYQFKMGVLLINDTTSIPQGDIYDRNNGL